MPRQYRKPVPKSQKEISNDLVNPYVNPENGETLGNPNIPSDFRQFTPDSQKGVDHNRSEKLSSKEDKYKPLQINLLDIDEAVMYYFENVISPFVYQNGERIKVPLLYHSPERFKTMQKDDFLRDKSGKIMLPIATFKRDTIDRKRNITRKLDANDPHLYTFWQKAYNSKNAYSNFNVLNNRVPTKQFVANVVPDYVTLTYSFIVQTYYVEQLNKILEAINYSSYSYWGDPERFKFRAAIDSFATTTELNQGQNRVVRSSFTLKVHGYLVPDVVQKDLQAIKKYNDKSKIIFGIETVGSSAEFVEKTNQVSPTFLPQPGAGGGGTGIDPATVTYLNKNIQKLGTYVNPTIVTFPCGWLTAPPGLPATSLDNFTLFVNGTLIEQAAIVSFTQSGGVTTLIIDPSELGFSFDPTDEIIAIGKFDC
jgi:hypothetical protein